MKDLRQINEMIKFVCLKCLSGCSVESGLESCEVYVGVIPVRNNGHNWSSGHRTNAESCALYQNHWWCLVTDLTVGWVWEGEGKDTEEGRRCLRELQDVKMRFRDAN